MLDTQNIYVFGYKNYWTYELFKDLLWHNSSGVFLGALTPDGKEMKRREDEAGMLYYAKVPYCVQDLKQQDVNFRKRIWSKAAENFHIKFNFVLIGIDRVGKRFPLRSTKAIQKVLPHATVEFFKSYN